MQSIQLASEYRSSNNVSFEEHPFFAVWLECSASWTIEIVERIDTVNFSFSADADRVHGLASIAQYVTYLACEE